MTVVSSSPSSLRSCMSSTSTVTYQYTLESNNTVVNSFTTKAAKMRRITFGKDPIIDVFIVNRVDTKYNLELFYQPEDFARFRQERNMEILEEERQKQQHQKPRRRYPKRDSMDLRKSSLQHNQQQQDQEQQRLDLGYGDDVVSPSTSILFTRIPRRGSIEGPSRITRPVRSSSSPVDMDIRRPMRPCSRTKSSGLRAEGRSPSSSKRRPMALAA